MPPDRIRTIVIETYHDYQPSLRDSHICSCSTYFNTGDSSILARSDEKENGHLFEYSENRETEGWGAEHKADLPHKIWGFNPALRRQRPLPLTVPATAKS